MSKFAIIKDGTVVNMVVAETIDDVHAGEGKTVASFATGAQIGGTYDGQEFARKPAPAPVLRPTAADVKAEAHRRIIAICPEWKQRNLTAQATQFLRKGEANWTRDEAAAWAAGQAIWDRIVAIRAASDKIEAMKPIPADYRANARWA